MSSHLLSPESSTLTITRTTSVPDISGELGNRSQSNASQCSKVNRNRTSHLHYTAEDLTNLPRIRSVSGQSSNVPNGSLSSPDSETLDGEDKTELSWQAFAKLRTDLKHAQNELRSRDDECRQLSRVRDEVDLEVEELTASLFEEAHKMVHEANVGRASAEKKYHEAQLKLDGLQAEVGALKMLVITSTPANPGKSTHKRAPSAGQICHDCETYHVENDWTVVDPINKKEVDPIVFQQFVSWIEDACPLKDHAFLSLIHKDDIIPCLRFPNDELAKAIYRAVQNNTIAIEPIKSKHRKCSLTKVHGECPYRVQTSDTDEWYPISSSCRSRIVSVIEFLTFLRYIRQGILKKDITVMYWDMIKKRAEICLATIGLAKQE